MRLGKAGLERVVQAGLLGRREPSGLSGHVNRLEALMFLLIVGAGRMVVGIWVRVA